MSEFKCPYCGKEYKSETWYQKHLNKKHDNDRPKPQVEVEQIAEKDMPEEQKMEEMFEKYREFNESLQNIENTRQSVDFNVAGDYIAILVISDLHYGNVNVNMDFVDRLLDFVKNYKRAYCVLNGDIIDNWVRLSPAGGTYEQTLKPEYQEKMISYKLEPIKDKILAVISGNHENRSERQGDKNPSKIMAEKLESAYLGDGGRLNLHFNEILYKMHLRHKFRYESSFNPCHNCGRLIEQVDSEADIVGIGHKHDPDVEVRFKAGKQRSFMKFGCSMPSTKYSRSLGYENTPLVAPTIIISGEKKLHHPFIDLDIVKQYIKRK